MHLTEDGLNVTGEDEYFSSFNQRVRDIAVNPYTGAVYVAFNGTSYPGSGPNIIKEFRNEAFASSIDNTLQLGAAVTAFPNPANDAVRFDWGMPLNEASYAIYSYGGQIIEEGQFTGKTFSIEISDWAAGSYFIRATHSEGTVTTSFQVSH
jgi:hypothetical protein